MLEPPQPGIPRALVWGGIVVLFFAAIAPTLTWLEFSGGMENLNIATALELRRDHPGNWLIPTLEGEPRVKKPPLTAWLTAAAIRPQTVAKMSSRDASVRRAAAEQLAWEVRWPSLLAACLMLVAVYELGRVVADPWTGVVGALIADNLTYGLAGEHSGSLFGAATTQALSSSLLALVGLLVAGAMFVGAAGGFAASRHAA